MNRRSTKAKRPMWAKKMPARVWRALCECQGTQNPTLRALKMDVEAQQKAGVVCHSCREALGMVKA